MVRNAVPAATASPCITAHTTHRWCMTNSLVLDPQALPGPRSAVIRAVIQIRLPHARKPCGITVPLYYSIPENLYYTCATHFWKNVPMMDVATTSQKGTRHAPH